MYPIFVNKFKIKRMTLFSICSLVTILSYLGLFSFVFFPNYVTYFPILCIFAFFAFFSETNISMIQDTIDYNEYKFNERRESSIFSLRAFTAKIASSIQQLILYIFLASASLFTISNKIANLEREYVNNSELIITEANKLTGPNNIELWQRVVFHIGFTLVPLILFIGTFVLIKTKYKLNEDEHREITKKLEERRNESSNI